MESFKTRYSFEDRQLEASEIIKKYPTRVPLICEPKNSYQPGINKVKYLVPNDLTLGQFMFIIRKHLKLGKEQALFMYVGSAIPSVNITMMDAYNTHHDEDGFLYIKYSLENTFGFKDTF